MSSDDLVRVAMVPNEPEAAVICGFLASRGIEATYRRNSPVGGIFVSSGVGGEEIFVRAEDAEAAMAALAEADDATEEPTP